VARYGGEEFLILLVGCDAALAMKRADDLRQSIAGFPFLTTKGALSITVSIGALNTAEWPDDLTVNQLLVEADKALYRAKESGRNRVCLTLPPA
jgi:diguanylate cyclase (GGDEF)-like protein